MSGERFRVTGRVQGVGFRMHAQHQARGLQISGYARNLDDGSVEIEAHGSDEALLRFANWLAHGPPNARVAQVTRSACDTPAPADAFCIG